MWNEQQGIGTVEDPRDEVQGNTESVQRDKSDSNLNPLTPLDFNIEQFDEQLNAILGIGT